MKRFLLLLLCFLIIFVVNCIIDDKVEIVKESIAEEPTIEEPAPVVEENIMEDSPMELKPIKLFSNYVVAPNAVYGIDGISLEKIEPVDIDDNVLSFNDFFLLGGDMYFSIENMENGDPIPDTDPVQYEMIEVFHYFKQSGADISDIGASNFPISPTSEHIEYEGNNFKIINFPYEIDNTPTITSRVSQGSLVVGYLKIDGYMPVKTGFWFSVAETIKTRYEGVYLWTIGGSSPNRVLESGRIY